jgi:KipI family sensor histidine kinase inhibitor
MIHYFKIMTKIFSNFNWKAQALGDHAIQFYVPEKMDPAMISEIKCFHDFIFLQKLKEIKDIIPSYHTLTLIYDVELLNAPLDFANDLIEKFASERKTDVATSVQNKIIEVPVCYDENFGIDLNSMSTKLNLSIAEIIKIHSENIYQVYCLGFMPGFAYMGDVNSKIQIARHAQPRKNVSAGSVGIAGAQTGIYPMHSPGGWQIIGRTPLKIFDKDPAILSKFKMGDFVKFYPISRAEFESLNQNEL